MASRLAIVDVRVHCAALGVHEVEVEERRLFEDRVTLAAIGKVHRRAQVVVRCVTCWHVPWRVALPAWDACATVWELENNLVRDR